MVPRRDVLACVQPRSDTHPGLWFDRFAESPETDGAAAATIRTLLGAAPKIPEGYRSAFDRRRKLFLGSPATLLSVAAVDGRMVIGLGAKNLAEFGLTLEHTWGVPFIPGSALKGLAAATAHQLLEDEAWRKSQGLGRPAGESFRAVFGDTDDQGGVAFHDAWWIPEGPMPLQPDTMTVHHPEYYQHPERASATMPVPADTDDPTPLGFVSVTGGYLVVLEADDEGLRRAAFEILRIGLADLGVGAKTNAGYGRLGLEEIEKPKLQKPKVVPNETKAQVTPEQRTKLIDQAIAPVKQQTANELVPALLERWKSDAAGRRELAEKIVAKLDRSWLEDKKRRKKDWVVALLGALEGPR